jgi:hypothetical protein
VSTLHKPAMQVVLTPDRSFHSPGTPLAYQFTVTARGQNTRHKTAYFLYNTLTLDRIHLLLHRSSL